MYSSLMNSAVSVAERFVWPTCTSTNTAISQESQIVNDLSMSFWQIPTKIINKFYNRILSN